MDDARNPKELLSPELPPAVQAFLRALRRLRLRDWRAVLAAAHGRRPGDHALLDALTVLAIATARPQRHSLRRLTEVLAARAMAPVVLPPAGQGDFAVSTGRQLGGFTLADQATLQFAAEWAAAALLVREELEPVHFEALYGPFIVVIPIETLYGQDPHGQLGRGRGD